jgi:hypothetical protein
VCSSDLVASNRDEFLEALSHRVAGRELRVIPPYASLAYPYAGPALSLF